MVLAAVGSGCLLFLLGFSRQNIKELEQIFFKMTSLKKRFVRMGRGQYSYPEMRILHVLGVSSRFGLAFYLLVARGIFSLQ
jgi:hypothetical protein